MLNSLNIKRFKSLRQLDLEFGQVNIFIGGNGAGKSNILEAIGILSACLGRGLRDEDVARKGVRITPPEIMKSSFKNYDLPKTFELEGSFDRNVSYKATLTSGKNDPFLKFFAESAYHGDKAILGRSYRGARAIGLPYPDRLDKYRGIWDQGRAVIDAPDDFVNEVQQFARFAIYTPQTDVLRGREHGRQSIAPVGLNGEGLPDAVSSFLRQKRLAELAVEKKSASDRDFMGLDLIQKCMNLVWLPKWASEVHVSRLSQSITSRDVVNRNSRMVYFIDKFMHESRNRLSVYDSSEGTLFLLFAAIILAHQDAPRIFALDNVDNALNPALTRRLVESIILACRSVSENALTFGAQQVFLTTHNPTALDAFDIFDDRQRIFVVDRDEQGITRSTRLQPHKSMTRDQWEIAKSGRNLSQLWIDGEIKSALGAI